MRPWRYWLECVNRVRSSGKNNRESVMANDNTWMTCRHVMDGSAEHVILRQDKICLCSACAENVNVVETEEVYILDEDRLRETIKDFKHVEGIKFLDRNNVL